MFVDENEEELHEAITNIFLEAAKVNASVDVLRYVLITCILR